MYISINRLSFKCRFVIISFQFFFYHLDEKILLDVKSSVFSDTQNGVIALLLQKNFSSSIDCKAIQRKQSCFSRFIPDNTKLIYIVNYRNELLYRCAQYMSTCICVNCQNI